MSAAAGRRDDSPLAAACLRLRHWLLHGPAQLSGSEYDGGVVGSFDASGNPGYVYGEIAGYFLHWLVDVDAPHAARALRAERAFAKCVRQFEHGVPPTRIALQPAPPDWRNAAVFLFDLAMLAGGLARATRAGLIRAPEPLAQRLAAELSRLVQDGQLLPLRRVLPSAELPDRWSTRLDNFEVKAATRILMLAEITPLPPGLAFACARLCAERAPQAGGAPLDLLHPTLYYAEGVLCCGREHWPGVGALLRRILALASPAGELPEDPQAPGVLRSDVIAQALRVGLLLQRHGVPGAPAAAALAPLAQALAARVQPDGSMPFRGDAAPLANTWCAMFAEQALRWWTQELAPDPAALV
jgi:hypothetical protein